MIRRVIRARVSPCVPLCPGSPRCLFTVFYRYSTFSTGGMFFYRYSTFTTRPHRNTALLDAVAAVWHVDQCERAQTTVSLRITHQLVAEHVHSQVRDTTCCSQRRSALTSVQRICSRHQRNTHSRAAGEPHRCDRRCFNGCKLVVCDGLSSRPNGVSSAT